MVHTKSLNDTNSIYCSHLDGDMNIYEINQFARVILIDPGKEDKGVELQEPIYLALCSVCAAVVRDAMMQDILKQLGAAIGTSARRNT